MEKSIKGKLNKAFLHFLLNFLPACLMIFLRVTYWKALQNFETSSNMSKIWQKMKEILVQLVLNLFFGWFWIPKESDPSLVVNHNLWSTQPKIDWFNFLETLFPTTNSDGKRDIWRDFRRLVYIYKYIYLNPLLIV